MPSALPSPCSVSLHLQVSLKLFHVSSTFLKPSTILSHQTMWVGTEDLTLILRPRRVRWGGGKIMGKGTFHLIIHCNID